MVINKPIYRVYKHVFPNGKVYIGITSQPLSNRWRKGKGYGNNPFLTRAFKKYGWENTSHFVVKGLFTLEEANSKEIELIKKYKSNEPLYGYNITCGGDGRLGVSVPHTSESKAKISSGNKGKTRTEQTKALLSSKMKGRQLSPEHIQAISEGHKGIKHTDEYKEFMRESLGNQSGKNNLFFGKSHSEETKERMSLARKAYWEARKGGGQQCQ